MFHICSNCDYFSPAYVGWLCHKPAACEHPVCFKTKLSQTFGGLVVEKTVRVKDILDLVDSNCDCKFFKPICKA